MVVGAYMRTQILTLVIIIATGCSGRNRPIEFVVPDGYRGKVWILFDPIAPDLPVVNGRYQASFPSDGVLRVGSMRPFQQWHPSSARYANGTPLHADLLSDSSQVASDAIGMWAGPSSSTWPDKHDYIVWVVGTESDFKAVGIDEFAPPKPR